MTDEQRKEAVKWVDRELRLAERHDFSGSKFVMDKFKKDILILQTIRSALEPQVVSREWVELLLAENTVEEVAAAALEIVERVFGIDEKAKLDPDKKYAWGKGEPT